MAREFKLPDVGEGLHEGEIVQWYVKEGEAVKADQHLVDVLTEKATVEITCPHDAKVLKLVVKPGEKIRVGEVIVVFGQEGETFGQGTGEGGQGRVSEPSTQNPQPRTSTEVLATPAVRKLAKELSIDLSKVHGSGPGGRIIEDDVRPASIPIIRNSQLATCNSLGPEERVPFSGIRRKTAEKMSQSKRTVAHVTHVDEADVTDLKALREKTKANAQNQGVKLTLLAYIIKATALSLKEFPYLNASLDEIKQEIVLKSYVNVSVAVDTDKGLVTPVIRDADKKSLLDIARELEQLVNKARAGQLALADFQGGTFTITNVGPIGGLMATPIVNYPEVGILGVMKIVPRPVVKDGQVAIRDTMNLCLSFDHRVLDGAQAARFVTTLIKRLESPGALS